MTFNLKEPKSKRESLIYLIVFHDRKRIKISTRQKIYPMLWDFNRKAITRSRAKVDNFERTVPSIRERINNTQHALDNIRKETEKFFLERNLAGVTPKLHELRDHIERLLNPTRSTVLLNDNVLDYLKTFIEEAKAGQRKQANGTNYSAGTLVNYKNLQFVLDQMGKGRGHSLRWDMIDRKWYYAFIKWHEESGYSRSYTGKHVKDLKCLMRYAYEEGVHQNDEFRKKYFTKPKDNRKKEPLSRSEIQLLQKVQLESKRHDLARNVFLVGCFMGLRISDIKQISPDKIFDDEFGKFLGIKQQKTKNFIQVPINSEADRILSKYDYQFPNLCEQVINRDLKVIAELAGIEKTRAKKLSIHISRHSFCRLAYQLGIPSYHIMKISGHRTERSFLQYINITSGEAMEEFRKHPFFQ